MHAHLVNPSVRERVSLHGAPCSSLPSETHTQSSLLAGTLCLLNNSSSFPDPQRRPVRLSIPDSPLHGGNPTVFTVPYSDDAIRCRAHGWSML